MTMNGSSPSDNISKFRRLLAGIPANSSPSDDISQDPDYQALLAESQQAHWEECARLISSLDEKYPGNAQLEDFKLDFEFQHGIIQDLRLSTKEYSKKKFLRSLLKLSIIIGILAGAFLIIWYGSKAYINFYNEKQRLDTANQISELSLQAQELLNSDQPDKAQELVVKMKSLDPNNPKTIELSQKTDALVKINNQYLDAVDLLKNGRNGDAIKVLTNIESQSPGYKDVPQLIGSTNAKIKITQALATGTKAYNAGKWQEAIDNLEIVLTLDPADSSAEMKGMLAGSDLQRITQLLGGDNPSLSDLAQADTYYNRALELIPQSKGYVPDQENLLKITGNLLEQRYTQDADQMIKDPAQTVVSINQAFNYLKSASLITPQDASLRAEIENLDSYKSGFQYYAEMNWRSAIESLTKLIATNENYANGFARQILYEAHTSQGLQYYSLESFLAARTEFESAETLVDADKNSLNFYLAEINLGRTLGKMNQFDKAAAYFSSAAQAIIPARNESIPVDVSNNLLEASRRYDSGQYEESYNLFYNTLVGSNAIFQTMAIHANQGNCLALIAAYYNSSVQAILEVNNLSSETLVTSEQVLNIPRMPR